MRDYFSKKRGFSGFEKAINAIVQWFFFYRMIFMLIAGSAIFLSAVIIWRGSPSSEKPKNLGTILACGSIIIGIFYTILNYEINYYKYKKDKIQRLKQASLETASDWHRDSIVRNLKITKKLYEQYKHLVDGNKSKEFSELLEDDEDARAALLSILNYLECIALGLSEEILDEPFIRSSFKSIFIAYFNDYDFTFSIDEKSITMPICGSNLLSLQ